MDARPSVGAVRTMGNEFGRVGLERIDGYRCTEVESMDAVLLNEYVLERFIAARQDEVRQSAAGAHATSRSHRGRVDAGDSWLARLSRAFRPAPAPVLCPC
jgi:hypothetical protein